jgi:anti-anti-sigma factor
MTSLAPPPASGESFAVDWAIAGHAAVLRLAGDLDVASVARLDEAMARAYNEGARTIVLDVSALEFIDSSGLRELVRALKRQRGLGGDLVLHRPTGQTLRLLDLVGLRKVFTITT